jgi:hypothetical protein
METGRGAPDNGFRYPAVLSTVPCRFLVRLWLKNPEGEGGLASFRIAILPERPFLKPLEKNGEVVFPSPDGA